MAIILVDIDGVTGNLYKVWYGIYNRDWHDCLIPENVLTWDLHKYVKPECGKKIYDYLKYPDLYDKVEPIDGSQWGINTLREMGHRCVFLSAGVHAGKVDFLKRNGFIETEKDLIIAEDKSIINGAYLIDDAAHNVQEFRQGIAILFNARHNEWLDYSYRAYNWKQVVHYIECFEGAKELYKGG